MTSAPSNSLDPSATDTADDVRDLLVRPIGNDLSGSGMGFWPARTAVLVAGMSPVLVWLRDHEGVQADVQRCCAALGLREVATPWDRKMALLPDPAAGGVQEAHAEDLPAGLYVSLRAYLADLPACDSTLPFEEQRSEEPHKIPAFTLDALYQGIAPSTPAGRAA